MRSHHRLPALAAVLLLFAVAPVTAQPSGSWQVHEGPDTPFPFEATGGDDQNIQFLSGADVPPASDPGWASASDDLTLRWTGGQVVQCGATADYAYFQTSLFPAAGDRYTLSFANVDDAAVAAVFNEQNPGGVGVPGSVIGLREQRTVDLTPALMAGATNRVVIALANVCGPTGTLHLQLDVEPGEGELMSGGAALPLTSARSLTRGERLYNEGGDHFLVLNPDGNLVVARADGGYVWGFDTQPNVDHTRVGRVDWQPDGNLAAYGPDGQYLWSALTENPDPTARLALQPNGALQIVSDGRGVLWSSDGDLTPAPASEPTYDSGNGPEDSSPGDGLSDDTDVDDEGTAMAMACRGALQTLLANNYDFAAEPDPSAARPGSQMSFVAAYAQFEEVAPSCRLLLEEPEAYVPASQMGALDALVARHQAQMAEDLHPNLSFTDRTGYLDGRAGIVAQGSRVPQYCPQQHRIQFSCDVVNERLGLSVRLLSEYMDFVAGGGTGSSGAMGSAPPRPVPAPEPTEEFGDDMGDDLGDDGEGFPFRAGQMLGKDETYTSRSGNHVVTFQSSGNLVLATPSGAYKWGFDTLSGIDYRQVDRVGMTAEGNLVAFNDAGTPIWRALPNDPGSGARLDLSPEGALQVLAANGRDILWSSDGILAPSIDVFGTAPPATSCDPGAGWAKCLTLNDPDITIRGTGRVSDSAMNGVANVYATITALLTPQYPKDEFDGFNVYITNGESDAQLGALPYVKDYWVGGDPTQRMSRNILRGGAQGSGDGAISVWISEQMICKQGVATVNADIAAGRYRAQRDVADRTFDQVIHEFAHSLDQQFDLQDSFPRGLYPGDPTEPFAQSVHNYFGAPVRELTPAQMALMERLFSSRVRFSCEGYTP